MNLNPYHPVCANSHIDIFNDLSYEKPSKKAKYHISDMDITFSKELTQEEMEKLFFGALQSIDVIGHRGCPH